MSEYYPLSDSVLTEINEQYPDHDRNTCSDENPVNYDVQGRYCWRCNALMMADYERLKAEYRMEINEIDRLTDELSRYKRGMEGTVGRHDFVDIEKIVRGMEGQRFRVLVMKENGNES